MKNLLFACCFFALSACSSNGDDPPAKDAGADAQQQLDIASSESLPPDQLVAPPQLPEVPTQSGVVYVGNFLSNDLWYYRVDGAEPTSLGSIDLGAETHDMVLDAYHDQLYVASDTAKSVTVYGLSRPANASAPVEAPAKLATISLTDRPRFVRVNPQSRRLYVIASEDTREPIDTMRLHAYDVSDASSPREIAGSPFTIPVTVSVTVDGPRNVLFLIDLKEDKLHAYDLHGDALQPLSGAPLDLLALFPQENSTSFQARTLTVDPWRNRLYAARSQGLLSELIAFEYPSALPAGGQGYGAQASLADFNVVADPFDVDVDADSRPHLLDAFEPLIDLQRGHVFLSAGVHTGVSTSALVAAITSAMTLADGCGAFEGFGCLYQGYSGGEPGVALATDGAACVDYTHQVYVGTGFVSGSDDTPGTAVFFRYDDALAMTPWLSEGGNLRAGVLPVVAACH